MARKKVNPNVAKLAQEIAAEHASEPIVYGLFDFVLWHGKKCIVTNAWTDAGRKITISPMGNGNEKAQYFNVFPDHVTPWKETEK